MNVPRVEEIPLFANAKPLYGSDRYWYFYFDVNEMIKAVKLSKTLTAMIDIPNTYNCTEYQIKNVISIHASENRRDYEIRLFKGWEVKDDKLYPLYQFCMNRKN